MSKTRLDTSHAVAWIDRRLPYELTPGLRGKPNHSGYGTCGWLRSDRWWKTYSSSLRIMLIVLIIIIVSVSKVKDRQQCPSS